MVNNRSDTLFKVYPLAGKVQTTDGMLPVPYHVYNGRVVQITGTASLHTAQELLHGEKLHLVSTKNEKALMTVWIGDYNDSSLNRHTEFHISFYVAHQQLPPLASNPYAVLDLVLLEPKLRQFIYRVWHDTESAVAYKHDVLGLVSRLGKGVIEHQEEEVLFQYADMDTRATLVDGHVSKLRRTPYRLRWALFREMGWQRYLKLRRIKRQEWFSAQTMNPRGKVIGLNADSQTYYRSNRQVLQLFDPEADSVHIRHEDLLMVDFKPLFIHHFLGFKFVQLNPHNVGTVELDHLVVRMSVRS